MKQLFFIFFAMVTTNNFVWHYFLGICPFIGVSNKIDNATGMGFAVTFVMTLATILCWPIYHLILVKYNLGFLQYVVFILVMSINKLQEIFLGTILKQKEQKKKEEIRLLTEIRDLLKKEPSLDS